MVTDQGLVRIGDLVSRAAEGERFDVYTHDATSQTEAADRIVATRTVRYMVTGINEIQELRFSDGSRLRCTPNHRVWTANRGWVPAEDLVPEDRVTKSLHFAGRPMARVELPEAALRVARRATTLSLPEKWDEDLAHLIGWLVGDGCLTDDKLTLVYGSEADRTHVMPRHQELLRRWTGLDAKPSVQANGTVQLRSGKRDVVAFFSALGVVAAPASKKSVPESIFEAPEDSAVAFLRGLYDADGCIVDDEVKGTRYVGLGSRSEELLLGAQELLASFGMAARIYAAGTKAASFTYTRKDGSDATYGSDGPSYDLRMTGRSLREFGALVDFSLPAKNEKLTHVVDHHRSYAKDQTVTLVWRESRGFETTYNLTEPRNHSYIVSGVVVANCSEYMSLDNSSCNLASLNLLKFLKDDDTFDATRFAKAVEVVITAMDISICFADFPTEAIGETTRSYRQLGIGYANLGALLMAMGLGYDSDGGRTMAAAITSLMTGQSYKRSAELAAIVGPYAGYARNAEAHKRVMRKHQAANDTVRPLPQLRRRDPQAGDPGVGRRTRGRRSQRLPQRPGLGARADRLPHAGHAGHHRPWTGPTGRARRRVGRQVAGPRRPGLDGRGAAAGHQVLRQRRGADPSGGHLRRLHDPGHAHPPAQGCRPGDWRMGLEADGGHLARRPSSDAARHDDRRTAPGAAAGAGPGLLRR